MFQCEYVAGCLRYRTPATPVVARDDRLIWIVDDSPLEAEIARRALTPAFSTRVFSSGATLLEQIVASPMPDVLLLDWVMPDVTGIEVCKFLRAMDSTSELSIVLLTSQNQTAQIVEGFAAGATDYLIKPYSPAELLARVSSQVRAIGLRERIDGAQQRIATALRKTELRYRALIDGLPDLLIVVSNGRISFLNPLAVELLAAGKGEQLLGQPIESIIHPDDREAATRQIAGVCERRPSLSERRLVKRDGSLINVELSAQSVMFDGEPAVVVTARDISEQKKIQGQLLVSERMATVGMLAAGVAHEINNPLASVLANVDYARLELGQYSDQSTGFRELEQSLCDAREAGGRVRDIVRDLNSFSRSDDAEQQGPVDVQRAIDLSLRMAWNQIRHRAKLVKEYQPVPAVLANSSRLGQVFLNLIINAAQAIPDGRANEHELRIATRMIGARVAIEVSDTGTGMPPEVLQRMFTPFFTTKAIGEGTGIGLSICHRIITGLGGEIEVESELGKGTTFRVLLNSSDLQQPAAPAEVLPVPLASRRGKILVIDDEVMIANAVQRILRKEHDVTGVLAGQLALQQIAAGERFDVIFCDVMMPQMTGLEFHARLMELAPDQARRIIFLSGGSFGPDAIGPELSNQRIDKPFDAQRLREAVNQRVGVLD